MKTRAEVFSYCRAESEHPSRNWTGLCQMFTRTAFGAPSGAPDATGAWNNADHKHRVTNGDLVPRCVPYYWTGGSHGHGHAVVSAGGGLCWSTDAKETGKVDLVRINDITRNWHLIPQGWVEDINGMIVWHPPRTLGTPRMDRIIEIAREARDASKWDEKRLAMNKVIDLVKPFSNKY